MKEASLLWDLAVVMAVAAVVTVVFHRLRQPVVLGYILAGLIIGPHTPPFPLVEDVISIETLAQLGVIFLMFSVGLEFNLRQLKRLGVVVTLATVVEIVLMVWLGFQIGRLFGWGRSDSFYLGVALSFSSTVIAVKALRDTGRVQGRAAELILGMQVITDIAGILVLAWMSGHSDTGWGGWAEVVAAAERVGVFVLVTVVIGLLLVPRLVRWIARLGHDEIFVISLLGLCFGMALLAQRLQLSVALGAFLMGALVAESGEQARIERLLSPLRDVFVAVFFVAVGLLIQPQFMMGHGRAILVAALAAVLGKILATAAGVFLAGNDEKTALRVGVGLVPIGEFSLVVAYFAWQRHLVSDSLYPIIVATAVITTFLTPYLMRSSEWMVDIFDRLAPKPLTTFLALYGQWVKNLQPETRGRLVWQQIRRSLLQLIFNAVAINVLFVVATLAARWVEQTRPRMLLFEGDALALIWAAVVLLTLPFLIAMFRKWQAMAMILGEAALPPRQARLPRAQLVAQTLQGTFLFVGFGVIGAWLLVLSAALWPPWPVLLALTAALAAAAFFLWKNMVRIHSRIQTALAKALALPPEVAPPQMTDPVMDVIQERYPWVVETQEVALARESFAAGRTIRELAVRKQSGATIIAIRRGSERITNPLPDTLLQAGDTVVLIGEPEQLARAAQLLSETAGS